MDKYSFTDQIINTEKLPQNLCDNCEEVITKAFDKIKAFAEHICDTVYWDRTGVGVTPCIVVKSDSLGVDGAKQLFTDKLPDFIHTWLKQTVDYMFDLADDEPKGFLDFTVTLEEMLCNEVAPFTCWEISIVNDRNEDEISHLQILSVLEDEEV